MSDHENSEKFSLDVEKLKGQATTKTKSLWNGGEPLFMTFWVYGFAICAGFSIIAEPFGALGRLINLIGLGWSAFMVKPIWLAADKYEGPQHWAVAAKIAAIVIALGVLGRLFD
ncbi:MAG: hypothetical protein ACK4NR_11365 [Micavibrio sp.]